MLQHAASFMHSLLKQYPRFFCFILPHEHGKYELSAIKTARLLSCSHEARIKSDALYYQRNATSTTKPSDVVNLRSSAFFVGQWQMHLNATACTNRDANNVFSWFLLDYKKRGMSSGPQWSTELFIRLNQLFQWGEQSFFFAYSTFWH